MTLAEKRLGEKLEKLASPTPSKWHENALKRQASAGWRHKSGAIALRVLAILDEKKMTQAALAEKLGVSRQHISQIAKGLENLTLETIEKLENALDRQLITIAGPESCSNALEELRADTGPVMDFAKKEKTSTSRPAPESSVTRKPKTKVTAG